MGLQLQSVRVYHGRAEARWQEQLRAHISNWHQEAARNDSGNELSLWNLKPISNNICPETRLHLQILPNCDPCIQTYGPMGTILIQTPHSPSLINVRAGTQVGAMSSYHGGMQLAGSSSNSCSTRFPRQASITCPGNVPTHSALGAPISDIKTL